MVIGKWSYYAQRLPSRNRPPLPRDSTLVPESQIEELQGFVKSLSKLARDRALRIAAPQRFALMPPSDSARCRSRRALARAGCSGSPSGPRKRKGYPWHR